MATASSRMNFLETPNYDVVVKTVMVGDSGVGKTSLLHRFSTNEWNPHYIATIGVDFKALTMERDAKVVKVQLWDTAGQERFRTITHAYYRGAHCVMMVFDVTSRESLENISFWTKDCARYAGAGTPMLLVANKCDLVRHRVVSEEEGREMAAAHGFSGYVETSAKDSSHVDQVFDTAIEKCLEQHARVLQKRREVPHPVPPRFGENVMASGRSRCGCS